jgi:alkylation response protein AidB-like acyl-CoA dehydrogenase
MNFEYTEEQQQLADSIRKYLANEYDFEKRKDHQVAWRPERCGLVHLRRDGPDRDRPARGRRRLRRRRGRPDGADGSLRRSPGGRALLDNIGLAGRLVSRGGSAAQRQSILPGLIDGKLKLAFAYLRTRQPL